MVVADRRWDCYTMHLVCGATAVEGGETIHARRRLWESEAIREAAAVGFLTHRCGSDSTRFG
jgi:hypothetical protein